MENTFEEAVLLVQQRLSEYLNNDQVRAIVAAREDVLARYQPLFSPQGIASLTPEDFRSFLDFKNNRHWGGLHRQGPSLVADMEKLRSALGFLWNEQEPITKRLDAMVDIPGIGRAVATAVLHVMHPDRCGILNNTAEAGLRAAGLWPDTPRGNMFQFRRDLKITSAAHGASSFPGP